MDVPRFPLFLIKNQTAKTSLQKPQNKCFRFCLNLPPRSQIDPSQFRKINWLPANDKVEHCIAQTVFKY